jgi:hypothetical protein
MTQQYLAGELSILLEDLQAATTNQPAAPEITQLRRRAETKSAALAPVTDRALQLADSACWNSLNLGDTAAFLRQATLCTDLWEFGISAGLLDEPDDWARQQPRPGTLPPPPP